MSSAKTQIPTHTDLRSEFSFAKGSSFNGVSGVWVVDSGKRGPTLGITMSTHGNEPSGLAALWYLRNHFGLEGKLERGKVIFVMNNVQAAENYFAACSIANKKKRDLAKREARRVDYNFNRLPENVLSFKDDARYETRRAQELRPIWSMFDIALDIHSTSKDSDPIIIACDGFREELVKGFPIEVIVTNIDKIQIGQPAISLYGKPGTISAFGIEAGSHEDSTSFVCARECVLALMQNLGMIPATGARGTSQYREYRINGAVILPTEAYEMTQVFRQFEPIRKGQVLARGNGTSILAETDGHALMGPPRTKPDFFGEEMVFLSLPVRKIRLK